MNVLRIWSLIVVDAQLKKWGSLRVTDQQLRDKLTRWTSAVRGLTNVCTRHCGVAWMKRYRLGSVQVQHIKTYSVHWTHSACNINEACMRTLQINKIFNHLVREEIGGCIRGLCCIKRNSSWNWFGVKLLSICLSPSPQGYVCSLSHRLE